MSIIGAEIAKRISLDQGARPEMVTMPKLVYDALIDEQKDYMVKDGRCLGEMRILGVKVLPDPDKTVLTFWDKK